MEIRKYITLRFGIIYFLAMALTAAIVVKLVMIQNVDTERWEQIAKNLKTNTSEIQAKRGNVCADDGSILATSIPYYELRFDCKAPRVVRDFNEKADAFSEEVAKFFGISKSQFKQRLVQSFKKGNRWFQIYPEKVNYNQLQKFKRLSTLQRSVFGSGLIVVGESERIMPHGDMASRTIGTLNKGAYGGVHGNIGYSGIEGMMEGYLAGENGLAIKRNYSGHWVDIPITEPEDGKDVITTINVNLQDFTQNALMRQMEKSQAEWGTAVVMEVATGDVKAIANIGRLKDGTYGESYNYALGHAGCSEPGSTFKLVSLMVAMEDGYVDTADVYDTGIGRWDYKGQTIYDSDYGHGGHGAISVKKILELSSNVGVAKVITKYYEGKERDFINRIYDFGLNKPLGLGFAGEGVPYIKYPTDNVWWGPSLAWISYGYEIKLTPIQTLTFYNAVANNGRMVKPRFVKEIRENGLLVRKFDTEVLNPMICSQGTLDKARSMLEGVCIEGTGRSLNNDYFPIAGKTGTAQVAYDNQGYTKGGKKYQASFCGYFPADDPKYSIIVAVVGPKGLYYGGSVAGPVFKEVVSKVYASFMEPRSKEVDEKDEPQKPREIQLVDNGFREDVVETAEELNLGVDEKQLAGDLVSVAFEGKKPEVKGRDIKDGVMPNVVGMAGSDALFLLEKSGLKVKMNGLGKVSKQSLKAGNTIKKGQTIYLELS
ncbi:penicillin-binding protein [Mangrovibacterium diazotrophicum]|uniref:Cell division protein FtsI (Penicillin-binding protein 3) n=1 Tax=Mangrovibacterium diazotrophicum TaxID=1261403 RepID=A0A419VVD3_9BACT|nr:penicillin-binding protein [Mangrovibacterium diazotrophicum]RKD86088.1 cell division protein FtsI (penicillin-binding protein 3) [Mangrovibacterium diazotrophicum]